MRIVGFFAAAAATLAIASPAAALTFSGTAVFDDSGMAVINGPLVSTPGTYKFEFTLDTAAYAQLDLQESWIYDFYDPEDETYHGGDDVQTINTEEYFEAPVTYGSLIFTLRPPYEVFTPPDIERGYYTLDFSRLTLYRADAESRLAGPVLNAVSSVNYTFSVTPLGGIPEPGTWAMTIIGFGAIGAFVRRRGLAPA